VLTRKPEDKRSSEVANAFFVVAALRCALIDSTLVLIVIPIFKLLEKLS
jgi:hypothetical protein